MWRVGAVALVGLVAVGCTGDPAAENLEVAEGVREAFYGFDADELRSAVGDEPLAPLFYYQGWAEGASYTVVERMPCELVVDTIVTCATVVDDDIVAAAGGTRSVTDTFRIIFDEGGAVTDVVPSSDDEQVVRDAFEAVTETRPELFEPGAPCEGFFEDGPTPAACARAFVDAIEELG